MLLVSMFAFSVQAFADEGAPVYSRHTDAKTSYTEPKGDNIAMVMMVKPAYTEEYEVQFFKDWFVVLSVHANDMARSKDLQSEVGVKQEYGPNPRVNSVKVALEQANLFPRDLANDYPPPLLGSAQAAETYLMNFLPNTDKLELPSNWQLRYVKSYRYEYQGGPCHYVFNVLEGDLVLAELHVRESGEIYRMTKYEMDRLK